MLRRRGPGDDAAMGTIVVGIDGSAASKEALRWALAEARLRDDSLRAVHAWTLPALGAGLGYVPVIDGQLVDSLRRTSEGLIDQALADVDGAGDVEVERVSLEGPPALRLVQAAEGADLLVVGSRGHGGFTGLLLGSVSQQCAHHALCPVVVVRSPSD
jgi:nucleotide-binding universal stress UspA family protein